MSLRLGTFLLAYAVEQVRQSLCCSSMLNVSISQCAYVSFSQNANLLRSFINITQGSNLLPGIINRPKSRLLYEDQVLYRKPKNKVLFVRIKLLYAELSPFQIQLFMVQLSQILNIRHLEIWFIQTILISTVFLKNNSTNGHGYSNIVSDGIDSHFHKAI